MKICENGHQVICYEKENDCFGFDLSTCPICRAKKEIAEWEDEGSRLNKEIEELKEKLKEVSNEAS